MASRLICRTTLNTEKMNIKKAKKTAYDVRELLYDTKRRRRRSKEPEGKKECARKKQWKKREYTCINIPEKNYLLCMIYCVWWRIIIT